MEIWNAYTKDGSKTDFDLFRDEPIPNGLYHIVSEVVVRNVDGTFLLMQRDWNKKGYPGYFEPGASGAILKDETPYQGAVRELAEETGIISNDLRFIFAQSNMKNTFYYGFLCITDFPKDLIILQKGETISYRWISETEFLAFMGGAESIKSQRDRWLPFLDKLTLKDLSLTEKGAEKKSSLCSE